MIFKKKRYAILTGIFVLIAAVTGGCAVYLNDYYPADAQAIAGFKAENPVERTTLEDGMIVFGGNEEHIDTGSILRYWI